jgi:phosphoglucosamine mutase
MSRKYFGTDGIRGRANGLITPELALKVGQAAGLAFQRGDHRHRVVIGKDTRLSGYMIEYAMVAGFTSVGMDVLLVGPMPTPAVAMLTKSMRADLGVMISASHNLFEDNGWHKVPAWAAPAVSTACMTATSNSPSARCRAICRSRACAS